MRPAVSYRESTGTLRGGARGPVPTVPTVMFSDYDGGEAASAGSAGLAIKYVGRGRLDWQIDGAHCPVQEGQFMCVWQGLPSSVEAPRAAATTTMGLCVLVPPPPGERPVLFGEVPHVFSAAGSRLGETLQDALLQMNRPGVARAAVAERLFRAIDAHLEGFFEDAARQLEGLGALKAATRAEALRRLEVARGHLHAVTDRPVALGELARVAGMSRFHLLRNFRDCFGAPPALYHRRHRLTLARAAVTREGLTCSAAAHRFGFADASSFSHAWRRTFGTALVRARGVGASRG